MIDVNKKWALITGASRGIGKQIALFMASKGCNLILHSRDLSHTKELLKEVTKLGVNAYSVKADLSSNEEIQLMLKEIDDKGTDVDIVFNNAGIQVTYQVDYFKTPIEDFDLSFKVNLIAVSTICYHFLPKMLTKGFGRIINTTSGITNEPQQAPYSASKAALDKYSTDLATTLDGTGVLLNLTDPGWCRTDLGGQAAPNSVESTIPGAVISAFVDDGISGRIFSAQDFDGLTLEEAISKIK